MYPSEPTLIEWMIEKSSRADEPARQRSLMRAELQCLEESEAAMRDVALPAKAGLLTLSPFDHRPGRWAAVSEYDG